MFPCPIISIINADISTIWKDLQRWINLFGFNDFFKHTPSHTSLHCTKGIMHIINLGKYSIKEGVKWATSFGKDGCVIGVCLGYLC